VSEPLVYPFTVDVYEPCIGAYLPVARFLTVSDARAHWMSLTLDGMDARVTSHTSYQGDDEV
jgi:hypothetical protein